jgi:hypothetical protein
VFQEEVNMTYSELIDTINKKHLVERMEELKGEYEITDDNCVADGPGKFDGKPLYALYYRSLGMDGGSDFSTEREDGVYVDHFYVKPFERELIPGLEEGIQFHDGKRIFQYWEEDDGSFHYNFVN